MHTAHIVVRILKRLESSYHPDNGFEVVYIYIYILDGFPDSLGFPIMHRVNAICTQSIIAIT